MDRFCIYSTPFPGCTGGGTGRRYHGSQDENKLESYVSTTENGKEMSGIAVSSQMDQTSYRDGDTAP